MSCLRRSRLSRLSPRAPLTDKLAPRLSCSLSPTHRHRVALGPVLALVEPHRAERERQPAEIVGKAYHQNDPAGNRADGGAIGKFRQARSSRRMDRYLAVIGERLDGENPNVVATQPPPRSADKRNVMARRSRARESPASYRRALHR